MIREEPWWLIMNKNPPFNAASGPVRHLKETRSANTYVPIMWFVNYKVFTEFSEQIKKRIKAVREEAYEDYDLFLERYSLKS